MRARTILLACLLLSGLGAVAFASSDIVQRGQLRVSFTANLSPHALPRADLAPVKVSVGAKISTTDGTIPPQLRSISISINRFGILDPSGLPVCRVDDIQPTTTADALAACGRSLVGRGHFSAKVLLTGQAPFPSAGEVYAFNGEVDGRPAILAHIYGTQPAPTSFTIPFLISRAGGAYGTRLRAALPQVAANSGYITGLSLTLGRVFSHGGRRRSYLSASCPAPKGFPGAVFSIARAGFSFADGRTLTSTLTRSCKAR